MKTICVLGLGYIGLPTASMFATRGYRVIGVDTSPRIVEILNNGDVHIQEPGLRTVVQAALRSGNMVVRGAPEQADVFIIAVPTPFLEEEPTGGVKRADLSFVRAAAESIVSQLRPGNLVVLESTSPPGTTARVVVPILERSGLKPGRELFGAYCPERVLPGHILEELVRNDRIIGGIDRPSAEMARSIYASFVEGEIHLTDSGTAEMVKLMENTYRDVNIALANEFALVAQNLGVNAWEAIRLANRHPRVKILSPGPGVGGHCIAVDPWFIAESAPGCTPLIQAARRVNDAMPEQVVSLIQRALGLRPRGRNEPATIACLGLAYKANVDDARESPALRVLERLQERGYAPRAYDPLVPLGSVATQVPTLAEAARGAGVILILTDHSEFKSLDPVTAPFERDAVIVDTRNTLPAPAWREAGYTVVRLGEGETC